MAKLAFVMIVYQSDYVLREAIQAVKDFGTVLVCEGPVKFYWKQGKMTSTDQTNSILNDLPVWNVVHGQWAEKDQMMNVLSPRIPEDTTHVWMVDADEVWRPEDVEQIVSELDNWDSVAFKPVTFFGGFDRVLSGFEQRFTWYRIQRWYPGARWATHRPPTVLSPEGKPWRECRHWDAPHCFAHYSYVFPKAVQSKIAYYKSRGKIIPNYFEKVWLPWVRGNEAQRKAIEDQWQGVHEWLPEARGDCYTQPFEDCHPFSIAAAMPRLLKRFEKELKSL